jgi:beta-lactamase regulating signal transducer with metallopeptidase domain
VPRRRGIAIHPAHRIAGKRRRHLMVIMMVMVVMMMRAGMKFRCGHASSPWESLPVRPVT